jgi:hypothetical protein
MPWRRCKRRGKPSPRRAKVDAHHRDGPSGAAVNAQLALQATGDAYRTAKQALLDLIDPPDAP